MKIPVMFYVAITTFLLVALTVMVTMGLSFIWLFLIMFLGQTLLIVMVYKLLRDTYTTSKTFDDFYEDYPIGNKKITLL
jgi:membrane protein implicated in regulation of membrane protease activity